MLFVLGGTGVLSCQTTLILPFISTATCAARDKPVSLERFCGVGENVAPASTERAKKMSPLPEVVSSQATLMLPPESTVNHALDAESGSLEIASGAEKLRTPLLERVKKMSVLLPVFSSQTTLMFPTASRAICGRLESLRPLERFLGVVEKCAPPSTERLKKTSKWPVL